MNNLGISFIVAISITSLSASCCGSDLLNWQDAGMFETKPGKHQGKVVASFNPHLPWRNYATAGQLRTLGCDAMIGVLQSIFEGDGTRRIDKQVTQLRKIRAAIKKKIDESPRRTTRNRALRRQDNSIVDDLESLSRMLKRVDVAITNRLLTRQILQDPADDEAEQEKWRTAFQACESRVIERMTETVLDAPFQSPVESGSDGGSTAATRPPISEAGPQVNTTGDAAAGHERGNNALVSNPEQNEQTWWQKHKPTLKKARNYALGITGAALLLDLAIRKKKSLLYKAGNGIGKAGKKVWSWLTGKTDANEQIGQVTPEEAAALAQQLLAEVGHESAPIEQGNE